MPLVYNTHGHVGTGGGKAKRDLQIRCINLAKRGLLAFTADWPDIGQLLVSGRHYRLHQLELLIDRMDGFVSLQAPLSGGEVVTKPLIFDGSVRVELLDGDARPLPGYRLRDCEEIYGNSIERIVRWKTGDDLSSLAGKPIRLRFVLRDADLYSLRFQS